MSRVTTITYTTTLNAIECATCALVFAITSEFQQQRRNDGVNFYCPAGHPNVYRKSELDKARERAAALAKDAEQYMAQLVHERDQRHAAERQVTAYKGTVTRMKKRTAAGVCPCCQRTFQQLARHMAGQHPDYEVNA